MTVETPGVAASLLLGCLCAAPVAAAAETLVVAHRGDSLHAPENTIAALEAAAPEADLVEFDVQVSGDGALVLMHDETVDRTSDGTGEVAALTLAELRALDVGSWFDPAFSGEPVPTLAEALDAALTAGLEPLVEHKAGSALAYDAELLGSGLAPEDFRVISFEWTFLADLDAIDPAYRLGALGRVVLNQTFVDAARAAGADFLDWSHVAIDQAAVDLVHGSGLDLYVYTVDDAARMRELIDFGVDGITTNDPELLRAVLVPEPAPGLLLAVGGLVLGVAGVRRAGSQPSESPSRSRR